MKEDFWWELLFDKYHHLSEFAIDWETGRSVFTEHRSLKTTGLNLMEESRNVLLLWSSKSDGLL